jgi:hypothetical protein
MGVLVVLQYSVEKQTAGRQDDFVSFYPLVLLTHEGHIGEVGVTLKIMDRSDNIFLKVIPLQAKFL